VSLNPRIRLTSGSWYLDWDADPLALAYDLIVNGAHVQAGKTAITANLGATKPTKLPQIAAAHAGVYETAVDQTVPPSYTVTSSIANGAVLSAPVTWEAKPSGATTKVQFYIDGALKWTESYAPYVFNGDGNKLDPATLANGAHRLEVRATDPGGYFVNVVADVTVQNATPPPPTPPPPSTGVEGRVGYFVDMGGGWADSYVGNTALRDEILAQWDGALSWKPEMTSWYPRAIEYINSMGDDKVGGECSDGPPAHPQSVLKDAAGQFVFLNFKNSSCGKYARYAADVGSQSWRDYMVSRVRNSLSRGFAGTGFDDVNLAFRFVGTPIDPRTGQAMTPDNWKNYFCGMLEYVRQQVPTAFICHNAIWFSGPNHDGRDVYTQRQAGASDLVMYEFGFVDSGLTGGTGEWSFDRIMKNMDAVHDAGSHPWVMSHGANTLALAELNLAGALLVSRGGDMVYAEYGHNPTAFWPGWALDLGAAKGPRTYSAGLFRRDFAHGVVLVNEPGASTKTVQVTGERIDGTQVTSVTLAGRQGAVILA